VKGTEQEKKTKKEIKVPQKPKNKARQNANQNKEVKSNTGETKINLLLEMLRGQG